MWKKCKRLDVWDVVVLLCFSFALCPDDDDDDDDEDDDGSLKTLKGSHI